MPEFISKVQHKTYEKGEFSDEKVRTLQETIELIKAFPYDDERALTSVELTGPSVTIQDEYLNYLKIGLYFNGKYCVYYLDSDNHLYEYYAPDINDACAKVTDFFNVRLDLQKFEKHIFSVGNQGHFVDKYFDYSVKFWKVVLLSWSFILCFLLFLIFFIAFLRINASFLVLFILGAFTLLPGGIIAYIMRKYFACANQTLQLSKGNSVFSFNDGINENIYNKGDIKEIILFGPIGGRSGFYAYEIYFKDNSMIKFSNMLISDLVFRNKFPSDLCKYSDKNSFRHL
jgi:hypothetical protein